MLRCGHHLSSASPPDPAPPAPCALAATACPLPIRRNQRAPLAAAARRTSDRNDMARGGRLKLRHAAHTHSIDSVLLLDNRVPVAAAATPPPMVPLLFALVSLLAAVSSLPVALAAAGNFSYSANITLSDDVPCIPSMYCPGGQTGRLCMKGHFCPTVVEELECPAGYFCPPASTRPRPCSVVESCPSGSYRYLNWGCLVLLIVLLPLLAVAGCLHDWIQRRSAARKRIAYEIVAAPESNKLFIPSPSPRGAAAGLESGPSSPSPSPDAAAPSTLQRVPRMEIRFSGVGASIPVNGVMKPILSDVTGHFRPGRLIAVQGPSGAGKSSLIAVLTGQVPLTSGWIETRIEGALETNLKKARKLGMIGVVPQADIMLPELTPLDIITHSAFTRLPATWSPERKNQRVAETIEVLGLSHVQHTTAGNEDVKGLSGGQRKRVNVGIELVASPSLLILDEPTTGLDSTSSNALLSTLKSITALQTTVVAVLHQPRQEIFNKFDDLLLLAPGGRTVFFGEAQHTLDYFTAIGYPCDSNTNPADWFIDVIAGKAGPPKMAAAGAGAAAQQQSRVVPTAAGEEHKSAASSATAATAASAVPNTAAAIQSYLVSQWRGEGGARYAALHGIAVSPTAMDKTAAAAAPPFRSDVLLPSAFRLTWLFAYRGLLQMLRSLSTLQLELFMHILCGGVIGMAFVDENWFLPPIHPGYVRFCPEPLQRSCREDALRDVLNLMVTYTVMALGLVAAIIGTRTFGRELPNVVRESSAGVSLRAYCFGKMAADLPLITLYSFLYCVAYTLISSPPSRFADFFLTLLLFEWVLFGIGYIASLLFRGENITLCACICSLLGGLATDNLDAINSLCWARWASEGLFLAEARLDLLEGPGDLMVQGYLKGRYAFERDNFSTDMQALLFYGLLLRIIAFGLLYRKYKQ